MEALARTIVLDFLSTRDVLPPAANGKAPLSSDPAAVDIRKEMKQERSQEFKRIMTVALCDLRDGVSIERVTAPLHQMLAILELEAHALRPMPRPLTSKIRSETKKQSRADLAEMRVIEQPRCASALSELINAGTDHISALTDVVRTAQMHRAIVLGVQQ